MESDNGSRDWSDMIAGWMEAPQQEVEKPLETGKGKKTDSSRASKRNAAQWQNYKVTNSCFFHLGNYGHLLQAAIEK